MRLKNQIALIVVALAATTSLVCGQEKQSQEPSGTKSIVGTWKVLRHGVNCSTGERLNPNFHALTTFNQGGTLIAYGVSPTATSFDGPEFGNWVKTGDRTYLVREVGYNYDENGVFVGRSEVTVTVTLAAGGDRYTGNTRIDIFDAKGNLLFSFCGQRTGRRFE